MFVRCMCSLGLIALFALLPGVAAAQMTACDDLSGIDFGPCEAVLGWGNIAGVCTLITGCSSPIPLFSSQEECEQGCAPSCDDLSNVDFGPCLAILGIGIVGRNCEYITGCSSPVPLFATLAECTAACVAVKTVDDTWGMLKARF